MYTLTAEAVHETGFTSTPLTRNFPPKLSSDVPFYFTVTASAPQLLLFTI